MIDLLKSPPLSRLAGYPAIFVAIFESTLTYKRLSSLPLDGNQAFPPWEVFSVQHAKHDELKLKGQHELALAVGFNQQNWQDADCMIRRLQSTVQLFFGESSFGGLVEKYFIDTELKTLTGMSEPYTIHYGNGRDNCFSFLGFKSLSFEQLIYSFDAEAAYYLSRGFECNSALDRFIYWWICIEVVLGACGKKREKFCRSELKSDTVNIELKRLKDLRNRLFHFGARDVTANECGSQIQLLRACALPPGTERDTFVARYEDWINATISRDC